MKIKRSELYALAWQYPMSGLAPQFGMSDTGLRNHCRKNNIPVPPRGHWQRLRSGQEALPTPLPEGSDHEIEIGENDDTARHRDGRRTPRENGPDSNHRKAFAESHEPGSSPSLKEVGSRPPTAASCREAAEEEATKRRAAPSLHADDDLCVDLALARHAAQDVLMRQALQTVLAQLAAGLAADPALEPQRWRPWLARMHEALGLTQPPGGVVAWVADRFRRGRAAP